MARKPRLHVPGGVYHVMLRGNGGQDIFFAKADRRRFLEQLARGVWRFGHRVRCFSLMPNRVHLVATSLVAIGTSLSAFWILALNSWMQTPAGYSIQGGEFFAEDWSQIIFSPSFPYRLAHMMLASFLTSAFLIAASTLVGTEARCFLAVANSPAMILPRTA